jgi:hypothetical protein
MNGARQAAGEVLRALKRKNASEPLKPALAIEALLAAARAQFNLSEEAARELLSPALADWRDAVGCADPLLVPSEGELPLPLPSWCTWLIDAEVLLAPDAPVREGPRVVLRASLCVERSGAVEKFPIVFAGRASQLSAGLSVRLAVSPPYRSAGFRGPVLVRAALSRAGEPVSLWLGAPASPGSGPSGISGATVATWNTGNAPPRWLVLRMLEGREPQALWRFDALFGEELVQSPAPAEGQLRVAVDVGSTATMLVEEDSAAAGSVGSKLLAGASVPSGFRLLLGDAKNAGDFGCSEELHSLSGRLPTALCAASPEALARALAGDVDQVWLPQSASGGLRVDRFKSPELLLLSDWPPQVPLDDPAQTCRKLLELYGAHLGRALAIAHAAPLLAPESGRWGSRWPRLGAVEAVVTYPECEPFGRVFEHVGRALQSGLSAAWPSSELRLVPDPIAAKAARDEPDDARLPVEAIADFGGLTLQMTVRLASATGRPAPFVSATSTSMLLGGERLIDAAAFASADAAGASPLRDGYRAAARKLRSAIGSGTTLASGAAAISEAVLGTVLALLRRQLEGTLRRASGSYAGGGVRLVLLGEGWKLAALDAPDEKRDEEALRRIEARLLSQPLIEGVPVHIVRMSKRRLCEGALRAPKSAEPPLQVAALQGIDTAAAGELRQRWFGLADAGAAPESIAPHPGDQWWREFSGGAESLLRVEQWFRGRGSPFKNRLEAGRLAFDARRPLLTQWLDVSGASLFALRIRDLL